MKLKGFVAAALALCLALSLGCATASAKVGDEAGSVYSTDIRAFINGVEVPSYNIGGRTAVVVEDVLPHYYNDDLRVLVIGSFDPTGIQGGRNVSTEKIGTVVGKIYETNIHTFIYDKSLKAYNLGGKTAVAIEDLGGDRRFNEFGGRYFWNAEERTISLEFLYENQLKVPEGLPYSLVVRIRDGNMRIAGDKLEGAGNLTLECEWSLNNIERMVPLLLDGETVGWYMEKDTLGIGEDKDGNAAMKRSRVSFLHYYNDAIAAAVEKLEVDDPTVEDVLEFYRTRRLADSILSFATENWTFAYMRGPTPHGNTDYLLFIKPNGTWHDFAQDLEPDDSWGTVSVSGLTIDRDRGEVRFLHGKSYVIDLKSGTMHRG